MNPFNFLGDVYNQMLINPRSSEKDKKDQFGLKDQFEDIYGQKNYFLVPSSGSASDSTTSVKLIALNKEAILNSATRVNEYFNLNQRGQKLNFGCVLPTFHIAGLGVYARAFLSRSPVFQKNWDVGSLQKWIQDHQIQVLSLVPAQIFDIVQNRIKAPDSLQIIFVGGSKLSTDLQKQSQDLGWKLTETYGMTETSSMIAVGSDELAVLPDVEVALDHERLKIRCNSIMTCSLQMINEVVEIKIPSQGWLQTEDLVQLRTDNTTTYITLLGRGSDFIKINSEGVSLSLLRNVLGEQPGTALLAVPNDRSEFEIILVYENAEQLLSVKQQVQQYNQKVRPFEKIRKLYLVDQIPKSELQKIKYKTLQQMIKGIKYEIA